MIVRHFWMLGFAALGTGPFDCQSCKPSPSTPSECWSHTGGTDGPHSAGSSEREPNDRISMANPLPEATCAPQVVEGVIDADVDAFRTQGARCEGAHPSAHLFSSDPETRLCLFVACRFGKTGVLGCPGGGARMHTPEGIQGCCRTGDGDVGVDVQCDGDTQFGPATHGALKPEITGYLVVDRKAGAKPAPYFVTYRF